MNGQPGSFIMRRAAERAADKKYIILYAYTGTAEYTITEYHVLCGSIYIATNHFILLGHKFIKMSNLNAFDIDETKFGGRKYLSGSSSSSSLPKTVAPTSDVAFGFSIDHNNNNDFSISDKIGHTQNASIPFRATKIKTIAEMEKMTDDSICLLKTADIIRKPEHVHLSNETSNATSSDKLKAKAFDESFSTLAVMLFKLCLLYSVFLRSKICTAPSNEVVAKIVRLAVNVSKQFILRIYW